jgi:hypothetical protein
MMNVNLMARLIQVAKKDMGLPHGSYASAPQRSLLNDKFAKRQ